MGIVLSPSASVRKMVSLRAEATSHREQIAELTDAQAKEYLLDVIERDIGDANEGFGRIKDAVPHADKQSVQILSILWNARPHIRTYGSICQELNYLNGKMPDERALNSAVKRLRQALGNTDHPIQISTHYGLGYSLHAPDAWQAPWSAPNADM